jgi:hypothetical protein
MNARMHAGECFKIIPLPPPHTSPTPPPPPNEYYSDHKKVHLDVLSKRQSLTSTGSLTSDRPARNSAVTVVIIFLTEQPQWARATSFTRFLEHTQQRTTVGRAPLVLDVLEKR